jgi:hypothetical protein
MGDEEARDQLHDLGRAEEVHRAQAVNMGRGASAKGKLPQTRRGESGRVPVRLAQKGRTEGEPPPSVLEKSN